MTLGEFPKLTLPWPRHLQKLHVSIDVQVEGALTHQRTPDGPLFLSVSPQKEDNLPPLRYRAYIYGCSSIGTIFCSFLPSFGSS